MADLRQAPPTTGNIWDELTSAHSLAGSVGTGLPRLGSKTVTFTGASGFGAVGTNTVWFTVTGLVLIEYIAGRVTTSLTGATATLTLGVIGQTALFIAATIATTMTTASEIWTGTTTATGGQAEPAITTNNVIDANIVSVVGVAGVASGVLEIDVIWRPLTPGATLV